MKERLGIERAVWPLIIVMGLFVILFVAIVGSAINESQARADIVRRDCLAIEHLKSYAYSTAQRSLRTLPSLAYYKEHPGELRLVLDQVRQEITFMAPKPC